MNTLLLVCYIIGLIYYCVSSCLFGHASWIIYKLYWLSPLKRNKMFINGFATKKIQEGYYLPYVLLIYNITMNTQFSQPKMYYALTTLGALSAYTDDTILFNTPENPLVLYDKVYWLVRKTPKRVSTDPKQFPLGLRFELPPTSEKPTQLSIRDLVQIGYPHEVKLTERGRLSLNIDSIPDVLLRRVSIVHLDSVLSETTNVAEKHAYLEKLSLYKTKLERYLERHAELITPTGSIEPELLRLITTDYHEHLDSPDKKGAHYIPFFENYGLRFSEWEIFDGVRGVINNVVAPAMFTAIRDFSKRLGKLVIPGTEYLRDVAEPMLKFLQLASMLKGQKLMWPDGRELEPEEFMGVFGAASGIPADIIEGVLARLERAPSQGVLSNTELRAVQETLLRNT